MLCSPIVYLALAPSQVIQWVIQDPDDPHVKTPANATRSSNFLTLPPSQHSKFQQPTLFQPMFVGDAVYVCQNVMKEKKHRLPVNFGYVILN